MSEPVRAASISLPTLLQMIAMEKATAAVEVEGPDGGGTIWLTAGELVHARAGNLEGVEAARRLVALPAARPHLVMGAPSPERTIHEPLMRVLLRVAQESDEEGREIEPEALHAEDAEDADPPSPFAVQPGLDGASTPARPAGGIAELLEDFAARLPAIVSSDLVHVESGLSIGGVSRDPELDASLAAASASEMVKANRRAARLIASGSTGDADGATDDDDGTEDILVTTTEVFLLIRMIGGDYCQVVAVGPGGNLGLSRAWMRSFHPRLLEAVSRLH